MITRNEIAVVGKFNKAHGIKGELSATSSMPAESLKLCSCIVCDIDGIFVPFFIKFIREKSQNTFLLTIDGIENEDDALLLANKDIYNLQKDYSNLMHEEKEIPVDFLQDFKVTINNKYQGSIADLDDSTANVLFVINLSDDSTKLIPAVDEFITNINIDDKLIELEVPEQLLEL